MKVESVILRQFRNYEEQEIEFHPLVNLIIGKNGQGKSNLIEAIQFALSGESFREGDANDLILSGSTAAKVSAQIFSREIRKNSEFILNETGKEIKINGKKVSVNELRKQFSTVVFSPDSLSIVKRGPKERRDFIDGIMTSLNRENVVLLSDYMRCLKSRNKILKSALKNELGRHEASMILSSLEPQYLSLASRVILARIETLKLVNLRAKTSQQMIFSDKNVDISVDYVISQQSAIDWSQNQVYDALKSRLRELHEAEWSVGQSLVGPHRHDVQFNLNGNSLRTFGSQGQQRAVVLSFKLAQIAAHQELHGEYPILLLDDVMSELDAEKRERFLGLLSELQAQIFLTTAELEKQNEFSSRETKIFVIEKGKVSSGWK